MLYFSYFRVGVRGGCQLSIDKLNHFFLSSVIYFIFKKNNCYINGHIPKFVICNLFKHIYSSMLKTIFSKSIVTLYFTPTDPPRFDRSHKNIDKWLLNMYNFISFIKFCLKYVCVHCVKWWRNCYLLSSVRYYRFPLFSLFKLHGVVMYKLICPLLIKKWLKMGGSRK